MLNNQEKGVKIFERYNQEGFPVYKNSKNKRLCSLEDCYNIASNDWICPKHRKNKSDTSLYMKSVKQPVNSYRLINNEYYELTLLHSEKAYKISKGDYIFSKSHRWSDTKNKENNYLTTPKIIDGVKSAVSFHAEVMKTEIDVYIKENSTIPQIDHINGDSTDNRRENLRVCTPSENSMNTKLMLNNTSSVTGVHWNKNRGRWVANISVNNKRISLGVYQYFRNAVKARIKAEHEYFGEYAFRNRNKEYDLYINSILAMPEIKEPITRQRPNHEPFIFGVIKEQNKRGLTVFRTEVYNSYTKKRVIKSFTCLDLAVEWKHKKEVGFYGKEIIHEDEIGYKLL